MRLKKVLRSVRSYIIFRALTGISKLPPVELRYRVHGANDVHGFLQTGRRCGDDIKKALRLVGADFNSFKHILDFGCGCGRTIMWFARYAKSSRLYGTDVDSEAILWCRGNLRFADFKENRPLPPLEYPSEMFELVYAVSVFTHLREDYQFQWLAELKRIIKTGGILLATVQGPHIWEGLAPEYVEEIKKRKFAFRKSDFWKEIFPEWYQDAYHTKDYVFDKFGEYFKVLDYIPQGLNDHQDMVILKKE